MNYAALKKYDIANGPGVRVSLFVSGCRNKCPGCFNPQTWDFKYGKPFTPETLGELLKALDSPVVTGLSILGGDPFEPENRSTVEEICETVRVCRPDRDIWIWTGYDYEDLKVLPVMRNIDVLIDGRFDEDKKDLSLAYRGSWNQRVIDIPKSLRHGSAIRLKGDWR